MLAARTVYSFSGLIPRCFQHSEKEAKGEYLAACGGVIYYFTGLIPRCLRRSEGRSWGLDTPLLATGFIKPDLTYHTDTFNVGASVLPPLSAAPEEE